MKPTDRTFSVPGVWERIDPETEPLPVVFDSPHSGNRYPSDFDYAVTRDQIRST